LDTYDIGDVPVYANFTEMLTDAPGASGVFPAAVIYGDPAYVPLGTVPVALVKVAPEVRLVNTDWIGAAMAVELIFVIVTVPLYVLVARLNTKPVPVTFTWLETSCGADANDEKFAVTLCGCDIVTVDDALLLFATFPVQLVNPYPVFGIAVRVTTVPGG
jgi:hypothetical protein